MRLTFLFALPRSRTQWFASVMGRVPGVTAWHDPSKDCMSPKQLVDKINTWMAENDGHLFIADTAALMFHEYLTRALPDMVDVYCYRRLMDVRKSVMRQTGHDWAAILSPMHTRLCAIRELGGSVCFDFDDFSAQDLRLLMVLCVGDKYNLHNDELDKLCAEVIDTPIRDQANDPVNTRSLLAYREIG